MKKKLRYLVIGLAILSNFNLKAQDFENMPLKNYWIEVNSGVNINETFTLGSEVKQSDRTYATTGFRILVGKKIFPKTFLTLGYYRLYYEYSYKSTFGGFDFVVSSGNTSTRIPVNLRHEIYTTNYRKFKLLFFGEGGTILELVNGRNHEVMLQSNLYGNENFSNGLYALIDLGAGTTVKFADSFGLSIAGQKTWGYKPFMRKDFVTSNNLLLGSASIDGTGYNLTIGVQYYF
jgi:hypothetical protein